MPLQNRVAPDGSLHAVAARGTMLGNRGGMFHRPDQTLGKRRWASTHWIACELHYKDMHHDAMGRGYTSLFFLDEVTALAAGHRPCFLCRRSEARAFLDGERVTPFDERLHRERLEISDQSLVDLSARKNRHGPHEAGHDGSFLLRPVSGLPNGTMVARDNTFFAKRGAHLLHWSFAGYAAATTIHAAMQIRVLTAPSILAILHRGYQPRWHPSAHQWDDK